jgi:glycosyltransferase involved in cell wall biosynthesis
MKNALVSIIVPCYNQSEFLNDCLSSVLRQTYVNWECWVVNDGSTDDFDDRITQWILLDKRIKKLSKPNGGLSSARNFGINHSTGQLILPLDADDMICPNYVKACVNHFHENTETKLIFGRAIKFGTENGEWRLPKYSFKRLLENNSIFCTAMYKKEFWKNIGGYDENMKEGWEDWDFWIRLLQNEDGVFQDDNILFYYRTKTNSMIKNFASVQQKMNSTRRYIFEKNFSIYQRIFNVENFDDFKNQTSP